jgi:flagellar motor switch/type III secretory pathway protein FliN
VKAGNGKARRFRLYGETERCKVTDIVTKALVAWAAEWLAPGAQAPELSVAADAGAMHDVARWLVVRRNDQAQLAVGEAREGLIESLVSGLSAADIAGNCASPAVRQLGEALMQDLAARLTRALDTGGDRGAAAWSPVVQGNGEISQPGSGWLVVTCEWGAAGAVQVLLAPELAARAVDAAPTARKGGDSLNPRRGAIDNRSVAIQVVLGEAELAVADLESLAPGDVIRLDRKLGDPLLVRNDVGDILCGAHVGAVGGRRAVQLVMKR